jgi:hypothetical protein
LPFNITLEEKNTLISTNYIQILTPNQMFKRISLVAFSKAQTTKSQLNTPNGHLTEFISEVKVDFLSHNRHEDETIKISPNMCASFQ